MKTKTLLIAAAALAAGVMSSQAQGVYSQNIVGYVNIPVPTGYSMIANPLDLDGTGTNNTVISVVGTNSLPVNSQVPTWNGTSFDQDIFSIPVHKTVAVWSSPSLSLNVGNGFFVYNPGSPTNITVVGVALVGTNSNPNFTPGGGYSALASYSPIGGDIDTNLSYSASLGDQVLTWNNASGGYSQYIYSIPVHKTVAAWAPSNPQISVGQGFFLFTTNTADSWTETVDVQ
jgi:hypothetical protein